MQIDFIPAANPFGINNRQRVNEIGIDINRDFDDFDTATANAIKDLIDSGEYDAYIDSHCLGGTSLTEGDLTSGNFVWFSNNRYMKTLGRQMLNYIGEKYSLETTFGAFPYSNISASYAYSNGINLSALTEIPANTPLYYGDTTGEVHGTEVVERCVDFLQNVIATLCMLVKKYRDVGR